MSLVDYENQLRRKARGKNVPVGPHPAEEATHEHTSFRNWCSYCVRASAADDPHHRQPHTEPEFPIIMADYCFMQDAPGSELVTILDMLDVAFGMMAAISVEEKGASHLRCLGGGRTFASLDTEEGDLPHRR